MGQAGAGFAGEVVLFPQEDADGEVREAASECLGRMGQEAGSGVKIARQVAPLLRDTGKELRAGAARALGRMGPAGAGFAGEVAELLRDKPVRKAASESLGGPTVKHRAARRA